MRNSLIKRFITKHYSNAIMKSIYQNYLLYWFVLIVGIAPIQAQTLYAVLVADITDMNIGVSCAKDMEIMSENLRQVSQATGYALKIKLLTNANFKATQIRAALDTLYPGPQDLLVFYYSGHGHNVEGNPSKYPFLNVADYQQNPLSLAEVGSILKAKNARLCLTIGDCCNNVIPNANRGVGRPVKTKAANSPEAAQQIIKKLFLAHRGSITISSSRVGQVSYSLTPDGSAYTIAFEEAFENCLINTGDIQWKQLLEDTQNRLDRKNLIQPQISIFDLELDDYPVISPMVVPATLVEIVPPQPAITYADLNAYLGTISDTRLSKTNRQQAKNRLFNYFTPTTHVRLFVNETEVESQSIDLFFDRIYLNGAKIREVNVIQKASVYDLVQQRYTTLAVQEIWNE